MTKVMGSTSPRLTHKSRKYCRYLNLLVTTRARGVICVRSLTSDPDSWFNVITLKSISMSRQ
jgi:hypothetical protein